MYKKSIFIFCFVIYGCALFGQNIQNYKNLDWRIFHKLNFSDYVDIQSEEWKNMHPKDKKALLQIPTTELKTMSTKELLEAYIDCRYTRSFFLFPEVDTYYEKLYRSFNGVRELISRTDVVEEIIKYYADMDPQSNKISPAGIQMPFQIQFIEYLIGDPNLLEKFSYGQLRIIAVELVKKYQIKIQSVDFEDSLESNIYAIAQVLRCKAIGKGDELAKIDDITFLQKTGRKTNDSISAQVINLANDFLGK